VKKKRSKLKKKKKKVHAWCFIGLTANRWFRLQARNSYHRIRNSTPKVYPRCIPIHQKISPERKTTTIVLRSHKTINKQERYNNNTT
jgi:hypothetical protein